MSTRRGAVSRDILIEELTASGCSTNLPRPIFLTKKEEHAFYRPRPRLRSAKIPVDLDNLPCLEHKYNLFGIMCPYHWAFHKCGSGIVVLLPKATRNSLSGSNTDLESIAADAPFFVESADMWRRRTAAYL